MSISGSLTEMLSRHLSEHLGLAVDIEDALPVGGGSINDAYRLETNEGPFFLKVNRADRFPSLFAAEADGLTRLRAAGSMRVPEVIAAGEDHDDTYLLMEFIRTGSADKAGWENLGASLAALHRHTQERFGLERDNYIGSLEQVNTPHSDWASFFIHCRLEPQVKRARDRKRLDGGSVFRFERLYGRLENLFPREAPALLHGDLWHGNFLFSADGTPVLVDPAVHYGHREMDLAMLHLFGGTEPALFDAYSDAWPLEQGWEERIELCNLYPLLVHVNLFGGGYAQQVEAVLKRHT